MKKQIIKFNCQDCGQSIEKRKGIVGQAKFCSLQCYWHSKKGKIVNQLFRENNPKWNPNKQSRTYPSPFLKEKVKRADNYNCYICGSKENLHVHHITSFKKNRNYTFENLITLCFDCHWKIHRREYQFSLSKTERRPAVWITQ